eukprot:m.272132 g.272132  ORF g.272132 m.272132 type:complete len:71 (-) comp54792_c1_seq8:1581-1793(-)
MIEVQPAFSKNSIASGRQELAAKCSAVKPYCPAEPSVAPLQPFQKTKLDELGVSNCDAPHLAEINRRLNQ